VVGANTANGPRAVAFVLAKPDSALNEAAMLDECRERIAAFKVPARIVTLEEFPVSEGANGQKIRLDVLREMATRLLRDDP
jgi:fatty-acyl-CoA synthase